MPRAPLVTVVLAPGSRVAVGDVIRHGSEADDLARVTEILDDGRDGLAVDRRYGRLRLVRMRRPVVVGVTSLDTVTLRRERDLESARRVCRRLNGRAG